MEELLLYSKQETQQEPLQTADSSAEQSSGQQSAIAPPTDQAEPAISANSETSLPHMAGSEELPDESSSFSNQSEAAMNSADLMDSTEMAESSTPSAELQSIDTPDVDSQWHLQSSVSLHTNCAYFKLEDGIQHWSILFALL